MARLVVNPDSPEAWEIELRPGANSLGRGEGNDFQIEHSSVSSSHCQVVVSGSSAMLQDLGSTNGTFVEGQLVEQAKLRSGQVFRLGDVELRFEAESAIEPIPVPVRPLSGARAPVSLRSAPRVQRSSNSAPRLSSAFLYPLQKGGVLLLVAGTIFFSIIEAARFFARFGAVKGMGLGSLVCLVFLALITTFGAGYLTSYLRRIVTGTAMGDPSPPDWPDFTDLWADIVLPFLQLFAAILASLVPAIILGMFVSGAGKWSQAAIGVAGIFGVVYFPMAFLAVAMFDSVAALNPLLIVPSILKIPRPYALAVVLLGIGLATKWAGDSLLPKAIPISIVPSVISTFVGLYFVTVEARLLGLLYLANKERLGWFGGR